MNYNACFLHGKFPEIARLRIPSRLRIPYNAVIYTLSTTIDITAAGMRIPVISLNDLVQPTHRVVIVVRRSRLQKD